MGHVERLRNKAEPLAALFSALSSVLANTCPPARHHSTAVQQRRTAARRSTGEGPKALSPNQQSPPHQSLQKAGLWATTWQARDPGRGFGGGGRGRGGRGQQTGGNRWNPYWLYKPKSHSRISENSPFSDNKK